MRRFAIAVLLFSSAAGAQIYDILLKNGHVIDPANHRNGRFDVAILGNKIARVAPDLPAAHGRVVIDAGAYFVTPGLIDIEAHFNATAQGPPAGVVVLTARNSAAASLSGSSASAAS